MNIVQDSCRRCGTCCQKGGPALHQQDLHLLKNHKIPFDALITIRKGELAHNPVSGKVQATGVELVKISGKGRSWECLYYNSDSGCSIYESRPDACSVLECWNPGATLDIVETDVLTRFDILDEGNPLLPVIHVHEKLCSCEGLEQLLIRHGKMTADEKAHFDRIVREDLRIRSEAVREFGLALPEELFYLGRPFFQLLRQLGVQFVNSESGLQIVE